MHSESLLVILICVASTAWGWSASTAFAGSGRRQRVKVKYERRNGTPVLFRLPEVDLIDDKAGKPVRIHQVIGRRPTIAFGNSGGDFEMLEWTTSGKSPRLGVLVHHTDAGREWAYDRDSHFGRLVRGLDESASRGWLVVDMKSDWNVVYPARH